jgi:hypothetical protein
MDAAAAHAPGSVAKAGSGPLGVEVTENQTSPHAQMLSLSPVYLVCEWLELRVMRVKSVCLVAAAVGPFEPGTWVFSPPLNS